MFRGCICVAVVALLAFTAFGQGHQPTAPVPCSAESGPVTNPLFMRVEAWSQPVQFPGARSIQLQFGEVVLEGPTDAIVITNPEDGEVQRLDRVTLKQWGNRTAWFNGSAVMITLELEAGSTGSVEVAQALVTMDGPGSDDVCGNDNRVLSADNRAFRLFRSNGGVCTGWLISDRSVILTAGHCFRNLGTDNMTGEFNVPLSDPAGHVVHPPVASQFPVDLANLIFDDSGVGNDWAVTRLHPNPNGIPAGPFYGHYNLPTTVIPTTMTARLTGYGTDEIPDPTRNFVQQSSTDSLMFPSTLLGPINHDIDSTAGTSGGPLTQESTGIAVGINTQGGCDIILQSNHGTSIFKPALQQAITSVSGCNGTHLLDGASQLISCSPMVYSAGAVAAKWNIVAVSGTSDWDVYRENTGSVFGGSNCDFLIANGNLNQIPAISGELQRASGSGSAYAEHVSAQVLALGTTLVNTWTSTRVIRAFQFTVPAGVASLNLSVGGDQTLAWHLYRPDNGVGAQWQPRGTNLIASGMVGGSQATGIVPPTPGVYCIVVFRNNAPFSIPPMPDILSVSVCAGGAAPVPLTASTPVALSGGCGDFTITPTPGLYNIVGVASTANYTLTMGPGTSATAGSATEFVAYNGLIGNVSPTNGIAGLVSGSAPATIEHVVATDVPIGSILTSSVGAGHVLRAVSFAVPGTGGNHEILITGHPSLRWYLFDPGFGWRGRAQALHTGVVGSTGLTLPLVPGLNALIIAQDGGVTTTDLPFRVRWGLTSDHLNLTGPGSTLAGLTGASYQFTCAPAANRWNAVGVLNTTTSIWALSIGNAESASTGTGTLFVLADGRSGNIAPTDGLLNHFGNQPSTLQQSDFSILNQGTATTTWTGKILHTFEFFIATAGDYDVGVTGGPGLAWLLFKANGTSAWRSRTTSDLVRSVGTTEGGVYLQPGWHSIVVPRGSGLVAPPQGTVLTCSVLPGVNPAPAISGLSPAAIPAGTADSVLTITGTGFRSTSTVSWNSVGNMLVLNQTSTQLQVLLPASFIAAPGNHTVQVSSPAPGGGTSAPMNFSALKPRALSVSPPFISPQTQVGQFVLVTVIGENFQPYSTMFAGLQPLPTTFISSTEMQAYIGASAAEAAAAGGVSITIRNGPLAQSNTLAIQVAPGGNNLGTLVRAPLNPMPNESYVAHLEGCRPGVPFSIYIDFAYPNPIPHWPNPTGDFVLRNLTPSTTIVFLDGIGLAGPPNPAAVFQNDPLGTPPGGVFTLTGFVMPAIPFNARFSMQTIYIDPTAALGFRLTWARTEDL